MAVTKKEIADLIHKKLGFSKRESADIVEYFFDTLKKSLQKGDWVKLHRFGSLYVKKRKPRKGRNPATGEIIKIPSRNEVVFKPSRTLREQTNYKKD